MITDPSGRTFKKLRVSLTHECNYACVYCVDSSEMNHSQPQNTPKGIMPVKNILTTVDLIEIIRKLHLELDLNAVRLTGGEPLLHPRINTIIAAIKDIGIKNIGMTTNGHMLHSKVDGLYEAGLKSVNISIEALSADTFKKMSRHQGLPNVLKSIEASLNAGLNVKLNTVIIAGKNEHEILPLLQYALDKGITIRFLELMAMGPLHTNRQALFFSRAQILEVISSQYPIVALPRVEGSTSDLWSINGNKAFGIIANDSSPFCRDCNRLRLDSYGNIYGCLSSLIPVSVSPDARQNELKSALQMAISHKQPSHFIGNERTMQSIGG